MIKIPLYSARSEAADGPTHLTYDDLARWSRKCSFKKLKYTPQKPKKYNYAPEMLTQSIKIKIPAPKISCFSPLVFISRMIHLLIGQLETTQFAPDTRGYQNSELFGFSSIFHFFFNPFFFSFLLRLFYFFLF